MRVWVAACLLAIAGQASLARDLDNRAYSIINDIIVANRLKGDVADRVCNALRNEAERHESFENALIFTYEAHWLANASQPQDEYLLLMLSGDDKGKYWVHLANCAKRFKGEDGTLPQVRYQNLTADRQHWLDEWCRSFHGCESIAEEYAKLREGGRGPREAYIAATEKGSEKAKAAFVKVNGLFTEMGTWMLTGYDAKQAQLDTEDFLEAWFVARPHSATDTRGVVDAFSPEEFMSRKLVDSLRHDEAHMLVPVRQVVSSAIDGGGQPARQAPLGGYNLNGSWVEKGTAHRYMIVHEGYKVSLLRMEAVGASPAGDVIFEADLAQKGDDGDYKARGKCYPLMWKNGKRTTSPDWEWYTGAFEIESSNRCFAQWLGGYSGVIDLVREQPTPSSGN